MSDGQDDDNVPVNLLLSDEEVFGLIKALARGYGIKGKPATKDYPMDEINAIVKWATEKMIGHYFVRGAIEGYWGLDVEDGHVRLVVSPDDTLPAPASVEAG